MHAELESDPAAVSAIVGVIFLVYFLVVAALYAWMSIMLSRVFRALGAEGWRAWVPVLSTMEVFRLGGVATWNVVFFFLPIVQLWGYVQLLIALHRINGQFGRGVGSTVLAALLPPVWATVLAIGPGPDPERARLAALGGGAGYADAAGQYAGYAGAGQYDGQYAGYAGAGQYGGQYAGAAPYGGAPGATPYPGAQSAGAEPYTPHYPGAAVAPPVADGWGAPTAEPAAAEPQPFAAPAQYAGYGGAPAPAVSPAAPGFPFDAPPATPAGYGAALRDGFPPAAVPGPVPAPTVALGFGPDGAYSDESADSAVLGEAAGAAPHSASAHASASTAFDENASFAPPASMFAPPPAAVSEPLPPALPKLPSLPVPPAAAPGAAAPGAAAPFAAEVPVAPAGAHSAPVPAPVTPAGSLPIPLAGPDPIPVGAPSVSAFAPAPVPPAESAADGGASAFSGVAAQPAASVETAPPAGAASPAAALPALPVLPGAAEAPAAAAPAVGLPSLPPPAVSAFAAPAPAIDAADESTVVVAFDDDGEPGGVDESTVVVDRRPVRRFALVLDDDATRLELPGERVVLGRNPAPADGVAALAVPDATRTLSKTHARLAFDGVEWRVTDLNSTNGVVVVDANGVETLLEAGATASVAERFVLGRVGLRIVELGVPS